MQIKKFSSGQSLIEAIFAITVVMVLVGGVVKLVSQSISAKTKTFDRKVAINLATNVIEEMVVLEKDHPEDFWRVSYWNTIDELKQTKAGYTGYNYIINIDYRPSQFNFTSAKLDVTVNWEEGNESAVISRYFTK